MAPRKRIPDVERDIKDSWLTAQARHLGNWAASQAEMLGIPDLEDFLATLQPRMCIKSNKKEASAGRVVNKLRTVCGRQGQRLSETYI